MKPKIYHIFVTVLIVGFGLTTGVIFNSNNVAAQVEDPVFNSGLHASMIELGVSDVFLE